MFLLAAHGMLSCTCGSLLFQAAALGGIDCLSSETYSRAFDGALRAALMIGLVGPTDEKRFS